MKQEKEFDLSIKRNELLDEIKKSMTGFLMDNRMDYLIRLVSRLLEEQDKEFIRLLKLEGAKCLTNADWRALIDKLAGPKLNGN